MIDKIKNSLEEAVACIEDGAVVAIGGFGPAGLPTNLIQALRDRKPKDLTLISNNCGSNNTGVQSLILSGCARKIICSYPKSKDSEEFFKYYFEGKIEIELVPQGIMADRLHAAGAGLGPFYTPTSYGTILAEGKETREFDGKHYVLQMPLKPDYALGCANRADRWGNLVYRGTAQNFNHVMCQASKYSIVQVTEIVDLGEIHPNDVQTPGIFVDSIVHAPDKVFAY